MENVSLQTQNLLSKIIEEGNFFFIYADEKDKVVLCNRKVETLLGDPSKAKAKLGWTPQITLQEMITEMVAYDHDEAKKHALLKGRGYHISVSRE